MLPDQVFSGCLCSIDGAMQAFNPLWPSILQDWMKPYQNTGHCFPQVGMGRGWEFGVSVLSLPGRPRWGHEWLER